MPKKSAPMKPAAVPVVPTKAKAPIAKATPPPPLPAITPAPVVKKPATKSPVKPVAKKTTIIAKVDVGWGNSLYLRGDGGGLSWDVGVLMTCAKDDEWSWSCPANAGPVTYKFVRNDLHWALGENLVVEAGATAVSTPDFPPW